MALKAEQLKGELTEKVIRQVRDKLSREKVEAAERFVRQFYANVPPDDILQSSPDELYGAALAIWQFGNQRRPGHARVRAYNPQIEQHGWHAGHTVVEIINDDMPFLVDSVTAELNRLGLTVHLVIHPVVRVRRDADGRLTDLLDAAATDEGTVAESFMHVEVDEQTGAESLDRIKRALERVLDDVRSAVGDWKPMRDRVTEIIDTLHDQTGPVPKEELKEAEAFLRWLVDDHFTFLGYREYRFDGEDVETNLSVEPENGLGILRDPSMPVFDGLRNFASLPPDVRHFLRQPRLLMVTKANRRATVHRAVPMDAIFVKIFDRSGEVVGERLFIGLFTSVAYNRSAREIPFLRQKVNGTLARAGFDPRSHDGKALIHILESFPRDELFQISDDELYDISLGVLHLQERQRIALFVRRDPFERFVSCLVYVPRDRYDTDLRKRIQKILEDAFQGTCTNFYTQLAESVLARVHFIIRTEPGRVPDYDAGDIEARLVEVGRNWSDLLQDALIDAKGEEAGLKLMRRYGTAFPTSFRERFSAAAAVFDIERIEETIRSGRLGLNLYRPLEAAEEEIRFKIYHEGSPVPLSDVLPMLEHMGLKVVSEIPFEIRLADRANSLWIHDFVAQSRWTGAIDLAEIRDSFHETFARVWNGEMEDDGFNGLVLRTGLGWREVVVVRAYAKFLRQARFQFSQDLIEDTLAAYARITRLIIRLFHTLHDPRSIAEGGAEQAETTAIGIMVEIEHALDAVDNLDEDRILRRFVNLVRATLRTNFFQRGADGEPKSYLSFKLDSRAIEDLPLPRPMVEIFVYSPRMEGVHLRGGKVARGGIRWSDRREDFRTEILGLMKAQMVKNAVIVPVGSKGGFVAKRLPSPDAGREAMMAEVVACYRTLIRGMLDITDNLDTEGRVIVPPSVVRRDGDDPYLVVAADKGTATFSDIANGISAEYGFWLGDAFASGGSAGYDHKKMGITARGAWESVKRHFRELGTDIQSEDFTCVGIGDMSGDVFGNGMLLSRHIRLVGAFNHMHIFCDPNPDAATGYAERQRLFDLPRSSWADYDTSLLSEGGGIFDRKAKSIVLSPQIKERFGIDRDRVTPAELIQAMLRARIDLLWFGGIGTYVKGTRESHADVGDKTNDALRVNADELRARVIGEGANLAVTQIGRIEFAMAGGRLNTDAIDNSAGVDTSDHEVNIKILVGDIVGRGDMTTKQRDQLLAEMTDEVAALVLADNYLQTQAISVAQSKGGDLLEQQARFMRDLEKSGQLNRALEFLPDDEELAYRAAAKGGLTRPEIAVLLAYAKIVLYEELLASDLPDDAKMVEDLMRYFPRALREGYAEAIERHRLRREIIATYTTNSMVNRVGPTFIKETVEKSGAGTGEIARAYIITREAFDLREIWSAIETLDNRVPADLQIAMLRETQALMDRIITWFLIHGNQPLDISAEILEYKPGVQALSAALDDILCDEDRAQLQGRTEELTSQGVPHDLARRVAGLPILGSAADITRISRLSGRNVADVAHVYFALGHRFGIEWLREKAYEVKTENHWQKQAVAAIVDDLFVHQSNLTVRVLEATGSGDVTHAIDGWIEVRQASVERVQQLLSELRTVTTVDLAMLAVANRRLRGLMVG